MHKFICRLNASENHCGIIKYKMYYNMQPIPGVETLLQLLSLQWSIICNYIFSSVYVIFYVRIIESVIKEWLIYQQHTQIAFACACVCLRTCSVCSSLWGSTAGGEASAAVTTGTNDVVAGCKQINAAAEVGTTCSLWHELVHWVNCPHCDDLYTHTHTWKEVKVRVACRWARMWLHFQC